MGSSRGHVGRVNKGLHAPSLGEADQGAQALDQELALVVRHKAFAGGIHERLELLPAWAPLPDLPGPHGDLRGFAGTGGTLIDDLLRQGHDLIKGTGVRVGRHGRSTVAWADCKLRSTEKSYFANASKHGAVPLRLRCK